MRALALVVAAGLASGCALDALLFAPEKHSGPYDLPTDVVDPSLYDPAGVYLTSSDGTKIHALLLAPRQDPPERATVSVLYCHGNAGNIGTNWKHLEAYHRLGYRVLAVDYRGYGNSEGTPEERGIYEDAEAALAHLLAQDGVRPERLVLFGHSLGAGVCLELAVRHAGELAGIIIEAPFRSVAALVADGATGSLPVDFVTNNRFDNYAKVDRVKMPLLVIHGKNDDYLMPRYGEELFAKAKEPKQLWLVPGAGHSTCPGEIGSARRQQYDDHVTAFIDGAAR